MAKEFHFPRTDERVLIIGRTGSGKTQLGLHVLAKSPFHAQPYVIVDQKRDKLIRSIDRVKEIDLNTVPDDPGLYVIRPLPGQEDETENWLWKVWSHEQVGLFFDEATLVPNQNAYPAILRQGRAKNIPLISLSQRPKDIPREVYSESEHIAVMALQDERDRKTVGFFTPEGMLDKRLKRHYAYWYDVLQHDDTDDVPYFVIEPVPEWDEIRGLIEKRLAPRHRMI
jgi:hypothetical protein